MQKRIEEASRLVAGDVIKLGATTARITEIVRAGSWVLATLEVHGEHAKLVEKRWRRNQTITVVGSK